MLRAFILAIACTGISCAWLSPLQAGVVKSSQTGLWSDTKTWDGGKVPAKGDTVLIRSGHAVTFDTKSTEVIRAVFIVGTLNFAPDQDTELNVGLIKIQHDEKLDENGFDCAPHPKDDKAPAKPSSSPLMGISAGCLCCDGKPTLLVGTPEMPIASGKTAKIRLHYIDGMDKETCPAIICCGGRMDFHGQSMNRTWVKLGATTNKSDPKSVTLAEEVTGWKVGDQVIVTSSDMKRVNQSNTEEGVIESIAGNKITLKSGLKNTHLGEGDYRAEVANLSRNVIVESASPEGVRGHTMYHKHSAGSISYAEFRHLGKENILGKYSIHYHLCGDSMRGSSVIGASIHHSQNRWVTIHGTNYMLLRDCVGYQSIGHGFFLEDGTEVYNILDRNLACLASDGKPLPKQLLPFDKNDGAGFWWANSHNTFTRNVAVDCGQYGFRFDAQPKAGTQLGKEIFGEPKKDFNLALSIRQPNGSKKEQDIRTLPFVRFEGNDSHGHTKWGLNMGQHTGGKVGPDASTPFVIRDMKVWAVIGGWGVEVPNVLIDKMVVHNTSYGVRESVYTAQDYRNFVFSNIRGQTVTNLEEYQRAASSGVGNNRARLPGFPAGRGDGGPKVQSPEIEVAKLNPIDKLPPQTIITHVRKVKDTLVIRGSSSDDETIKRVIVNGKEAKSVGTNFNEWEIVIDKISTGPIKLTAHAEDEKGNVEITKHEITIQVR